MQPVPSTTSVAPFSLGIDSALHKMTDDLLGAAYVLLGKTDEHFPRILQELLISHCGKASANQAAALTQKEQQDLAFLQSFGDSLQLWIFNINNGIKNPKRNDGEHLIVTLADTEDSDAIAMALQIGIGKLGLPARTILRSRYNQSSTLPNELQDGFEKRWGKRLKHIGALRRIYEEVEYDLSLDPLSESSLSLPILFTCIELGELLIRKGCIPSSAWICELFFSSDMLCLNDFSVYGIL